MAWDYRPFVSWGFEKAQRGLLKRESHDIIIIGSKMRDILLKWHKKRALLLLDILALYPVLEIILRSN